MPSVTLTAAPLLGGVDLALGDNRILERDDLVLVSVATPLGGDAALADALSSAFSLDAPSPTRTAANGDVLAIRTTPDQILLALPRRSPDPAGEAQARLGGAGYTTDQSDVWVVLEISGPDTLAALERVCPLNLDSDRFPNGAAARTVMEHMGALIVRLERDRFLLMSASSSAASFLHAVETSYRYAKP